MRNSLPRVAHKFLIANRGTLRAALAAVFFGGAAVAFAAVAVSPGTGRAEQSVPEVPTATVKLSVDASAPKKLAKLKMPGAKFWSKDPVVVDSVTALGYLIRVENIDDPTYLMIRRRVSDEIARRMKIDADALNRAWSRVPRDHQIAVLAAVSQLGVPYVEGKEDPHVRMDCSGLLWYAWRTAGVDAPRVSTAQLDPRMRIDRRDAMAGDIAGEGKHVHMYLGVPKAFIHAPYSGRLVRLKIMKDAQWNRVAWTNPSNIATYRL